MRRTALLRAVDKARVFKKKGGAPEILRDRRDGNPFVEVSSQDIFRTRSSANRWHRSLIRFTGGERRGSAAAAHRARQGETRDVC